MADNKDQKEDNVDGYMEVKVEPTLHYYIEEGHENSFSNYETISALPSSVDVSALNLWTSKATTCLISQYKKYRSMVGQSTQIRSLREMFEMISLEMRNYGFYFSPQKCENKWRVLERKYKNLVFRERLKKPGRMRHYGQWEHKRALDEIFNEKKKHVYLEENNSQSTSKSAKYSLILKSSYDQSSNSSSYQQNKNSLTSCAMTHKKDEESLDHNQTLTIQLLIENFIKEMGKNFALVEKTRKSDTKRKWL